MATLNEHPILDFWFGAITPTGQVAPEKKSRWWKKSPEFDALCRENFEAELQALGPDDPKLEEFDSPRDALARILLCDQMPRNIYRGRPDSFAWDSHALSLTIQLVEKGTSKDLLPQERAFALMPLMHSEDPDVQTLSVLHFSELSKEGIDNLAFAISHKKIIDRFGRYPHRNEILGRPSSPEEIAFLNEPGSSF